MGGAEKMGQTQGSGGASFQRCSQDLSQGPDGKTSAPLPTSGQLHFSLLSRSSMLGRARWDSRSPALPQGSGHKDGDSPHSPQRGTWAHLVQA